MKTTMKRCLAMALAVVMTLSTVTFTWAEPAQQAPTKTLGTLLTENYSSLNAEEKALLQSGLLNEATYTYTAPDKDNGDNLVSINADAKTVTAKAYTNGGYTWVPESAQLMVNDVAYGAAITLEKSGSSYVGSFTYTGTSYSVAVTYKMYVTEELADQNKLLSAAKTLSDAMAESAKAKEAVTALNELLQLKIRFSLTDFYTNKNTASSSLPETPVYAIYAKLNADDGGGIAVISSYPDWKINYTGTGVADRAAMKALTDDAKDGKLETSALWQSGGIAENLLTLCSNTGDFATAMQTIYARAQTLQAATNQLDNYTDGKMSNSLTAAKKTLDNICADLKEASEYNWSSLNGLVKTTANAATLDSLVGAVTATSGIAATTTKLLADTTVVTANMAQATVNVKVEASVYKTGATVPELLTVNSGSGATLRIAAGESKSNLDAAVTAGGLETNALAGWSVYDVNATNYTREVTVSPAVPATGMEDGVTYTYTITYTPKAFAVSASGCSDIESVLQSGKLPYGYNLTLPVSASASSVWDYTVNGEACDQGSVVRITGATTITRAEGKAWEQHNRGTLIAENYASGDAAASTILGQSALNTGAVRLRTPSDADNLLTVSNSAGGYTVTAKTYKASTGSLKWVPVTAIPVVGGVDQTPVSFTGSGDSRTAVIANAFDSVRVTYQLQTGWSDVSLTADSALELLNLPYTLTTAAKKQLAGLQTLAGQYSNLETVNNKITLIKNTIKGDDHTSQESKDAIQYIIDHCCDSNNKVILYSYIGAFKDLNEADRLAYFYQNQEAIIWQLNAMYEKLNVIRNDANFNQMLEDAGLGEYSGKIDSVVEEFETTIENLQAPNAAIKTTASDAALKELTAALVSCKNSTTQYTSSAITGAPTMTTTLQAAGIGKKSVTVNVVVKNSDGSTKTTKSGMLTFDNNSGENVVLTAAQVTSLNNLLGQVQTAASLDTAHYSLMDGSDSMLTAGATLDKAATSLTFTYTPNRYTVEFAEDGQPIAGSTQTFYYDNPVITLPASTESGFRYDYSIGGNAIIATDGKYTFTGNFDSLFAGGTCTVTRTKVDTAKEKLIERADAINKAIAQDAGSVASLYGVNDCLRVAAIPYEDTATGALSLVLRMAPASSMDYEKVIGNFAAELLNFESITVGSDTQSMLEDGKINLQSLLNQILNSGMSLDTALTQVTPDGDIIETNKLGTCLFSVDKANGEHTIHEVPGCSAVVNDADTVGLSLMGITMTLDGTPVTLYVNFEDFDKDASSLKTVRDLAQQIRDYGIEMSMNNGALNISTTSDAAYQALMGMAVALDQLDVSQMSGETLGVLKDIVPDLYENVVTPIVSDSTSSVTTIQNTLKKVGITSIDVSGYQTAFKLVKSILNNLTFSGETSTDVNGTATYGTTACYDINTLLNGVSNEGLKEIVDSHMVVKQLTGNINLTLKHSTDYAAMMLSTGGQYVSFPRNTDKISVTAGNTMVVLAKDIKSVTVKSGCSNVVIDLNGHSLDKVNCSASDRVIVVNSTSASGSVTNAGNATDGAALAKTLYTVTRTGSADIESIEITVIPDAGAWKAVAKDKEKLIAVGAELAAEILMRYGNIAKSMSVSINGESKMLYDLALTDLVDMVDNASLAGTGSDLLDCLNLDGINALLNDIIDRVTDFDALSNAIANNEALASYAITCTALNVKTGVNSGNYVQVDLADGKQETTTVSIKLSSDAQYDGAKSTIQTALNILDETVVIDADVSINDLSISGSGKNVKLNADVSASADVALTTATTDFSYNLLTAMVVAKYGPVSSGLKTELINGVKAYINYEGQDWLKTAMEKVTSAQLIEALKAMKETTFGTLANNLGISNTLTTAQQNKMSTYADMLLGIGKVLSKLDVTGNSATLTSYKSAEYGVYGGDVNRDFNRSVTRGSVTGTVTAHISGTAKATLFAKDDIVIRDSNGAYLYTGSNLSDALLFINADASGVTMVLSKEQTLTGDVTLNNPLTIQGKTLNLNGYKFNLNSATASVTMTGITEGDVTTNLADCYVDITGNTASVKQYVAKVNGTTLCKDWSTAMALLGGKGTLEVLAPVTLNEDVQLTGDLTITGANKITANGHKFILTATSLLISDAAIPVEYDGNAVTADTKSCGSGKYAYAAGTVYNVNKNKHYDGLQAAVSAASEGDTLQILKPMTLTDNVTVKTAVKITGKTLNMNGKQFVLSSASASVTMKGIAAKNVTTNLDGYYIVLADNCASVKPYVAKVNGKIYKDWNSAISALGGKGTLEILAPVTMSGDVQLTGDLTITGADKITANGHSFILTATSLLISDAKISVTHNGNTIAADKKCCGSGKFAYACGAVYNATKGTYSDSLQDAVNAAANGDTLLVIKPVTLTGNVKVSKQLTIKNVSRISWNGYSFVLTDKDAKLTGDDTLQVITDISGYEVVQSGSTYTVAEKTGTDKGYVKLDVQPSGINASQLQQALRTKLDMPNATVTVLSGMKGDLVANGAKVRIVNGSMVYNYTVIIMGDTNCNGKTDSGDAVKMRNHYYKTSLMTGVALMAADMNQNDKIDSGDAVKNRVKYQDWNGYTSATYKVVLR